MTRRDTAFGLRVPRPPGSPTVAILSSGSRGMQMRATIFGVTMATLMATVAVGEDVGVGSANQHLPGCRAYLAYSTLRDPTSFYKAGYCVGTVGGIALSLSSNSMAIAASRQPSSPYLKCADIPDSTEEQWVRVVVAYIEARPQRMHEQFAILTEEALQEAWPCRK